MIINGSSYPLRIPLDSHPQDVSLKVYRGCLAWRGEGVVDPVELGPGEGVRVLLPDAQVDRGGEAGLAGEVGEGLCQAEQREEREEKHVEVRGGDNPRSHCHTVRLAWLSVFTLNDYRRDLGPTSSILKYWD